MKIFLLPGHHNRKQFLTQEHTRNYRRTHFPNLDRKCHMNERSIHTRSWVLLFNKKPARGACPLSVHIEEEAAEN